MALSLQTSAFQGFSPARTALFGVSPPSTLQPPPEPTFSSSTALFAKKSKAANAKLAALEALEALEEKEDDVAAILSAEVPLSKKEQMALQKQQQKEQKKKEQAMKAEADAAAAADAPKGMTKKELKLAKMLALEESEDVADSSNDAGASDEPNLSKKELKALKKKEEKMAAKAAAKAEKKAARQTEMEAEDGEINGDAAEEGVSKHATYMYHTVLRMC